MNVIFPSGTLCLTESIKHNLKTLAATVKAMTEDPAFKKGPAHLDHRQCDCCMCAEGVTKHGLCPVVKERVLVLGRELELVDDVEWTVTRNAFKVNFCL